jgi:hypothetical protein
MAIKKNERYRCVNQMLLRNRRGKRVIGCRQRAESTLRVRPGYETDVLTEFLARLELRANRGANPPRRSVSMIRVFA